MCADLYEKHEDVKKFWRHVDDLVGFSLSQKILQGSAEDLTKTSITQPALFVASFSAWMVTQHVFDENVMFAGHSVGEYVAAVVSGSLDCDDAVRLLAARGRLMEGLGGDGSLTAFLGGDETVIMEKIDTLGCDGCAIALYNAPGQYVVGGPKDELAQLSESLVSGGAVKRAMPLQVSGPFHTKHMFQAQEEFKTLLNDVTIKEPSRKVISSVTGGVLVSAEDVRDALSEQIVRPVLWTKVMEVLYNARVECVIEMGPGNVLKGLCRRAMRDVPTKAYQEMMEKA